MAPSMLGHAHALDSSRILTPARGNGFSRRLISGLSRSAAAHSSRWWLAIALMVFATPARAWQSDDEQNGAEAQATTGAMIDADTSASVDGETEGYSPAVAEASDEWRPAMAAITSAEGITVDLFAAEPLLANPVCLWIDNDGSVYVGETHRHHAGVTDIREHWDWLDDDLAAQTVADRVAYIARFEGDDFADYSAEHDRLVLIRDTDGDGVGDRSTVFADGFNDPAAGIGASVLAHDGAVYYTCIPDLWWLRDNDGDDVADERRALSSGYGVKTGLLGHDLHGLRIGPDGRLYFSIGDRSLHVETDDGVIDHAHTGAVLRCNLDGGELEIFATGLRNPQDLVFDAYGNLWTGDNNSDGGDEARWVHLVQGGDSGWRFSYQWINEPVSRGPWNDEQLWHPRHDGQAAYLLPPVDNIANGPSGLAYYPGVGLSAAYNEHFFLCDFLGGQQWSGVHSFAVEPDGAGFTLVGRDHFLWDTLVTDCDFGPDGALYFTDWVEGWNRTGKGRVFRASDKDLADDPLVLQTALLLSEGMTARTVTELDTLLDHADLRVRQAAQFELVDRGDDGLSALKNAAMSAQSLFARLHGLWGLGMVDRGNDSSNRRTALEAVLAMTRDGEAELRAQAWRVLGDENHDRAATALLAGLSDDAPRVRLFAALAAGLLGPQPLLQPALGEALVQLFDDAGADDVTLRHGAVMALLGTTSEHDVWQLTQHDSPHVRMGAVLALRRLKSPLLGNVLQTLTLDPYADDAALLALEVARAIHDVPVEGATASLAELLAWPQPGADQPADLLTRFMVEDELPTAAFVRRVLAANRALGAELHARRVAAFASRDDAPDALRVEALEMLAEWAEPSSRDPVMGDWRPLGLRDGSFLPLLAAELGQTFTTQQNDDPPAGDDSPPAAVAVAFIELVSSCAAADQRPLLADWVRDNGQPSATRVAALTALIDWPQSDEGQQPDEVQEFDESPGFDSALLDSALADSDGALRAAALPALRAMPASQAWRWLPAIARDGEVSERRVAYQILGSAGDLPGADALLAEQLQRLDAGLVSPELALDLVQAAKARGLADPRQAAGRGVPAHGASGLTHGATAEARADAADDDDDEFDDDLLLPWLDTLFGGHANEGRNVFERSTLACQRCHNTDSDSGFRVGPDLARVGQRLTRLQMLTAIVDPNRRQSPGYGGTLVFMKDGTIVSGRVVSEDDHTVSLLDGEGELHELASADIDERRAGLSAMPEGLDVTLTPGEMRDLIAYLGSL